MTVPQDTPVDENHVPAEDLLATYGQPAVTEDPVAVVRKKQEFKAWHHPVKQIVRTRQWAVLTKRLIADRPIASPVLRYFTLPGPDLLDVRVLAEACAPLNVKIEYFGFDLGSDPEDEMAVGVSFSKGEWITAESALRQAGRITEDAIIYPDRLEDIAIEQSQASEKLKHRGTFDIVNIDACDHLAYRPVGRTLNTFDALCTLLSHQMLARSQWLLFITTRVEPGLLGDPGLAFQRAISENLSLAEDTFGTALADCIEADRLKLATALTSVWATHDFNFLKLYSIGLGKFLLQFFHGQPNLPANVELASAYAYRVHHDQPDMLALAFRVTPGRPRAFRPGTHR
jgi:hypothetical protein